MDPRFTSGACYAMQLAEGETLKLNHEYTGTEHILLGCISAKSGAYTLLCELGANPDVLAKITRGSVQCGPTPTIRAVSLAPHAQNVLEYAVGEARHLKCNYVDEGHILLGLLREKGGLAERVLREAGVRIENARDMFTALLPETLRGLRQELIFFVRELKLPVSAASFLTAVKTARDDHKLLAAGQVSNGSVV